MSKTEFRTEFRNRAGKLLATSGLGNWEPGQATEIEGERLCIESVVRSYDGFTRLVLVTVIPIAEMSL